MDEMADSSDAAQIESTAQRSGATSDPSDMELVARVRGGDEAAFEELFNRHRRRVALIASRFFRRREQIEEIIQESFTKAYFALEDFSNQQEASFAAWLSRIAYNSSYDELRRMKRRPTSALGEIAEEEAAQLKESLASAQIHGASVEDSVVTRDLTDKLLARLGADDRMVLVMLDAEGLSVAEIAEMTGWSVSKVKVRAHRARAALRRIMKRFL